MDFGAGRWETWAQTAGEGRLETAQKTSGGSYTRETFEVPDGVPVSDILPLFLSSRPPGDGSRRQTSVFNTTLGQEIPFTWADGGDTPFGRLFTVSYWGMEERLWLDSEGMVVREEMLLGVHAREPGQGEPSGDLPLESVLSLKWEPAAARPQKHKSKHKNKNFSS